MATDSFKDSIEGQSSRIRLVRISYDLILSLLYAWCVYQAYIYDAKTHDGQMWVYIVVYGGFVFVVRSYAGIAVMNFLSALTIPLFLLTPTIQRAGSYILSFQPIVGFFATFIVTCVQLILLFLLRRIFRRKHMTATLYLWIAGGIAFMFTILFTILVSVVHSIAY